jgi:hypothetical protein
MRRAVLRVVGVVAIFLGASCGFETEGLDEGVALSPAETPVMPAGTPAPPAEKLPSAPAILRANKVEVKRLSVGVLFARKVHAKNGTVTTAGPPLPPAELQVQSSAQDVEAPELSVEVLYADEVEAKNLTVRELHAADVKIGPGEGAED